MITKEEVLNSYKRRFITNFDIGEHLFSEFSSLLKSKNYHHYSKDVKDKYIPFLIWNEYGDFKGKMWNLLEDKKRNKFYYGYMDCALVVPKMIDRFGGVDMLDREVSNELCDIMFAMYKDEIES